MTTREFVVAAVVVAFGAVGIPAGAQTKAPRTPWGDPDLQGTYTNTYEASTHLEKPKEFEGRRLEDVKGE
jgi:hypothetical protein